MDTVEGVVEEVINRLLLQQLLGLRTNPNSVVDMAEVEDVQDQRVYQVDLLLARGDRVRIAWRLDFVLNSDCRGYDR